MSPVGRPVTRAERVGDLLARRPDALVHLAPRVPQLERLGDPAIRRVMGRLLTIEEAARMAGIDPAALVAELNRALGLPVVAGESPAEPPRDDGCREAPASGPVVELDVREDLRAGREPFSRIMAAVADLEPGGVLALRTLFEPVPLYAVLGRRGLAHQAHQLGRDDWSVQFWAVEGVPRPSPVPVPGPAPAAVPAGAEETWLDVRGLEPPEPMVRTLAALEELPAGRTLVQLNVRVPQFLLPILAERGFRWDLEEPQPGRVLLRIRRAE